MTPVNMICRSTFFTERNLRDMKVFIGEFVTESNANIPTSCIIEHYNLGFDDECIRKMRIQEVYEQAGIKLIPSIYANAGSAGVITSSTFTYIESIFINTLKKHLDEIDGIFLMLHGASEVEGIGSGDHHILASIREVVGPYLPIAVVCDPHGNLSKEFVEATTIIRSYRESPHIDADETMLKVSKMLCNLLKVRQNIHSVYRKLPLILGGEQSVSADEPVASINRYMDEIEQDPRILSASWHVGYIRHDCDVAGCGIVVVPATQKDQTYAEQIADELADYVWQKRHEFHYTGLTAQPDDALQMALAHVGKPVFITDSGDNVTSGAGGWNTFILRQFLKLKDLKKQCLFATICDPKTYTSLISVELGKEKHIALGCGNDELSKKVELDVIVKSKGNLTGFMMHDHDAIFGQVINVTIKGYPIDIMIANTNFAVCEEHQFVSAGIDWDEYDIIVVKEGYIFPELKEKGDLSIMSLTRGATIQDTSSIPFKRIMRPMFPMDDM